MPPASPYGSAPPFAPSFILGRTTPPRSLRGHLMRRPIGQSCDVPVCHGRILLPARVGGDTAPTGSLPRHPCT
eukprot:scaffold10723_cov113-Isochrysis_galbana.AAC.8